MAAVAGGKGLQLPQDAKIVVRAVLHINQRLIIAGWGCDFGYKITAQADPKADLFVASGKSVRKWVLCQLHQMIAFSMILRPAGIRSK